MSAGLNRDHSSARTKPDLIMRGGNRCFVLRRNDFDTDLSVPGLVKNVFGTQRYMAPPAGHAKSRAKMAASRCFAHVSA